MPGVDNEQEVNSEVGKVFLKKNIVVNESIGVKSSYIGTIENVDLATLYHYFDLLVYFPSGL